MNTCPFIWTLTREQVEVLSSIRYTPSFTLTGWDDYNNYRRRRTKKQSLFSDRRPLSLPSQPVNIKDKP